MSGKKQASTFSSVYEGTKFGWLDKLADPLQQATNAACNVSGSARKAKSWLNGAPIRHRVHPALIVWPIGAWTTATFLDLLDSLSSGSDARGYRSSADASIAFGIAGAL